MIKIVIITLVLVGVALLFAARQTGKSANPDVASSAVVPEVAGFVVLAVAGAITVGFALYRLFFA